MDLGAWRRVEAEHLDEASFAERVLHHEIEDLTDPQARERRVEEALASRGPSTVIARAELTETVRAEPFDAIELVLPDLTETS